MDFNELTQLKESSNNGEIFTPQELAEEMINQIPEHHFLNKNSKFLDPCCGTGTFLIALIEKLREYNWTNEEIQNGVYGMDSNPLYTIMLENMGFKNIYNEDFTTFDFNNI